MSSYARRRTHQRASRSSLAVAATVRRPVLPRRHPGDAAGLRRLGAVRRRCSSRSRRRPARTAGWPTPSSARVAMTVVAIVVATPIGILAGTYLAGIFARQPARRGRQVHQRHAAVGALDHHRPVRLYHPGGAVRPFLGLGRAPPRSALIALPVINRTTQDMLALVPNALREAAAALGAPRWKTMTHRHLPRRPQRHPDRRAAGRRPRLRRDRAAALHRAQQPVLVDRSGRADGQPAGGHLPVRDEPL